jgi:squalene-hopene/tetraprenyl-beta-curcumene cyclase
MDGNRKSRIIAMLATLAIVGHFALGRAQAGDEARWDGKSAARYLDARATEWAKFGGANRGQGADKVSCVSCHTMLSYAFGRPAVRHLEGDNRPTAQEDRMLEHVRRRVANWKELDTPRFKLSYDHDERKKLESWGTESVLNALLLSLNDRRLGLKAPSDSTRTALHNLWATQNVDGPDAGSWDWLDFGLRPWEASESRYYGAALAAIAVGSAPGYLNAKADSETRTGVDRLRQYFRSHFEKQNLHNRIWTLWASTLVDGLLTGDERDRIVSQVFAKQQDNGGWNLPTFGEFKRQDNTPQETGPDGYATGLALHTLQLAGVPKDRPEIAKGLAWLRTHQHESGAWIGHSLNKRRDPATHAGKFMTDASTAFALLALDHH